MVAAILLIALKLGAGLAAHSLGLVSEALHSGTDLVAALLTFFAVGCPAAGLVAGFLKEGEELNIESLMPENGVIFSDGVEADFLPFHSGSIVRLRVSQQRAHLVTA